ncbi:zinc finger BED domain-containing protein RICESLEEPER 2-like [Aristolochia californica]|uniref:zinc finger BED domain-containing protein RICESLEEPER 2-like n=1 Tax=Aristolochia californica TaxID=171875 RepID=UPI0035DE9CE8
MAAPTPTAPTSDNELVSTENQVPAKRRRKKSMVWEHFTIEAVAGGCTRACCKRCKQTFAYSTGSKLAGTSHLKRHIALGSCPKSREKMDKKQLTPYDPSAINGGTPSTDQPRKRYRGYSSLMFDQDRSLQDMVKMIILHEYPLHIVEHSAFVTFVQNLQPRFRMIDFGTVETECLAIYQKEKQNVLQFLSTIPGRICLTLDLYMSSQTLGYMCLTGQFICGDWKLHRRILNFTLVSFPHTGNAHAGAIGKCLADWDIESKLFTITFDHSPSNDNISLFLRDLLSDKNTLAPSGRLFTVRCYAHILNLIAQNGLEAIHEIVYKVRESVKYARSSPEHEQKFMEIVQQLQITSTKTVFLDVQTQWNTTYLMLVAASEFKQAFSQLETCDSTYNEAPSAEEWKKVETLCKYLKVLYDAAHIFTGIMYPTANMYFHEAWKIQLELSNAAINEDPLVASITKQMHEKFNKYWSDCSLVLAMAVVMDPRFKMKLVEFSYSKIYGDNAGEYVKIVDETIHDLFLEYVTQPLPLTPAYEEQSPGAVEAKEGGQLLASSDGLLDFDVYISEMACNHQSKSELDQYLEESLIPRIQEFDILNWWKLNKLKYPTLSQMARDILAIPTATVTSEFMFSTGNKVLDDYRSSLKPETVEAIVCAKDWLQYQHQQELTETSNAIVKVEF